MTPMRFMTPKLSLCAPAILMGLFGGVGLASAQAFSQVAGSAGSVAGRGDAADWTGLMGSASRATIGYAANGQSINPPDPTKFATTSSGVQGKDLPGFSASYPGGYASSQGASTVANGAGGGGAPTYYSASWTANQYSDGSTGGSNDSGTFDPYDIRYGDVSGLASGGSGPLQLYFQSGIRAGSTTLRPSANTAAAYGYSLFLTEADGRRLSLIDLGFSSKTGLNLAFTQQAGIEVYLLGANANDTGVDPDRRLAAGQLLTDPRTASALIGQKFRNDGSLVGDLLFGVRRTFQLAPGGSANDRLFTWHTDTSNRVTTVPEPASLGGLAVGALALLRRHRRS